MINLCNFFVFVNTFFDKNNKLLFYNNLLLIIESVCIERSDVIYIIIIYNNNNIYKQPSDRYKMYTCRLLSSCLFLSRTTNKTNKLI